MDVRVARDALLEPGVLRVSDRSCSRMTLQAERVRARGRQHARVRRTVREVASRTAFHLDRLVFENERSTLVAVALEANHVLIRRRPKLTSSQCAVRIVAIAALDQPFFHAMMERLLEIGFLFGMAREAQRRLLLDKLMFQS